MNDVDGGSTRPSWRVEEHDEDDLHFLGETLPDGEDEDSNEEDDE